MYLVSAGRQTFRPWTYTSDDSYMYQLSLVVATATLYLFLFKLFCESYMVVDVVQNPQKSNVYEYEKKHVRRDSKMCCCCCCRFCCGSPTTDERIHAPVLHDASQIDYTAGIEVAPHYHQLLVDYVQQ